MDFVKLSKAMAARKDKEMHRIFKKYDEAREKLCVIATKDLELDKLGFRVSHISEYNHELHLYKYDVSVEECLALLDEPELIERFGKAAEYFKYEVRGIYKGYKTSVYSDRRDENEVA